MQEHNDPPETVLLAEDDDDDYQFFLDAIKELPGNIQLQRAENGDVLMAILSVHVPNILFLDIQMPCKDGRQCIREIRADERYDRMPVIVYSSIADLGEARFFYSSGANLYMQKPASYQSLREVLRLLLPPNWNGNDPLPPLPVFVIPRE